MKKLTELTEVERLELFEVEELETRLEMWSAGNGTCTTTNTSCPVLTNVSCGIGGSNNYDC